MSGNTPPKKRSVLDSYAVQRIRSREVSKSWVPLCMLHSVWAYLLTHIIILRANHST